MSLSKPNKGMTAPRIFETVGVAATFARVAELVDALDLGSSGATRESSSLSFRTIPLAVSSAGI